MYPGGTRQGRHVGTPQLPADHISVIEIACEAPRQLPVGSVQRFHSWAQKRSERRPGSFGTGMAKLAPPLVAVPGITTLRATST